MRVIYGSQIDTTVPDDTAPADVMNILKESFAELSNGTYAITNEGGVQVMRVSLRSGSKAVSA